MACSWKGRFFSRRKSLEESVRGDIIDDILKGGGDSVTAHFPGQWTTVGSKYKVHGKTVKDIWEKFVPRKLGGGELHLVEAIKTQKPSISYKLVKNNVEQHANIFGGTSISAVGRAVRSCMTEGLWTWKRMSRTVKNKFSAPNVNYSQDYLNFISQIDLYRLKFFDEMGVCLSDCNKRYGHSLRNTPCVEVGRLIKSAHVTFLVAWCVRYHCKMAYLPSRKNLANKSLRNSDVRQVLCILTIFCRFKRKNVCILPKFSSFQSFQSKIILVKCCKEVIVPPE